MEKNASSNFQPSSYFQLLTLTSQLSTLQNKRILIREDFNVPVEKGKITDETRIQRALPTLKMAMQHHARVLVLSHFGRPTEGEFNPDFSLAPVAAALSKALQQSVPLLADWLDGFELAPGQIALAENVRFNIGEKQNDPKLAKKMASLCDVFVMDAFATAHRAQASTVGIAEYAPIACAGPLLIEELTALTKALDHPQRPLIAIVGGSKVSTKIQLLKSLIAKVDTLIVGGGMANTFLAAQGYNTGNSLVEKDWLPTAKEILQTAKQAKVTMPLPADVAVAKKFSADAVAIFKTLNAIENDDIIMDIGPQTIAEDKKLLQDSGTIVWNGPVGVFEFPDFGKGTQALGHAIAESHAYSIAGGGDTLAALDKFHLTDKLSYVSTGGGAFLMFLEGSPLPAVEVLKKRFKK